MTLFQVNSRKRPSSGFTAHYFRESDREAVLANYAKQLANGEIVEYEVMD